MDKQIENKKLVEDFKNSLQDNLLSIFSYGQKYERYLIIPHHLDFDIIEKNAKLIREWEKKSREITLMSSGEISSATKIFALEFLNIKMDYNLLYGKDIFTSLKFKRIDVIRELQFYLRSKLMNLRKGYIAVSENRKKLSKLVMHAVPTLMPMCCGMFFLKKKSCPDNCSTMLTQLSSDYKIDLSVLNEISMVKDKKISKEELKTYVKRLTTLLESLYKLIGSIAKK